MKFIWGLVAFLCSTLGFARVSDLEASIKIDGIALDAPLVAKALDQCRLHEPKLSPAVCIETFWLPRWLLDKKAKDEGLRTTPAIDYLASDFLQEQLTVNFSKQVALPDSGSIERYLSEHQRDFEKPVRIRVFRILLATEEEAKTLIEKLGPATTIEEFRKLAREKSLDNATHERGGDLGFLWPDGSTDVPQVSCDKALYQAATALEDGEIAPIPIVEGKRFSVVWRRGMKPAVKPTEASRHMALLHLVEKRTEEKLQKVLTHLKQTQVKDRKNILLGKLRRKEAKLFKVP